MKLCAAQQLLVKSNTVPARRMTVRWMTNGTNAFNNNAKQQRSQSLKALAESLGISTLHMDEFSYRVALEKGLSVWNDTCGADNKIAAKCLGISQPDVNWPVSYSDKGQSVKKQTKKWARKEQGQRKTQSSRFNPHHTQFLVFALGIYEAPHRWRSFPPHTGTPLKLCGTPEQMPAVWGDSSEQEDSMTG